MSPRRRLIIFLTIAVGLVLLLVLIFGIGGDSSQKKTDKPAANTPAVLTDYISPNSKMVLTTGGKVNGDDIYREIRITVDSNTRELQVIQGYQNTVIQTNTFANNLNAYDTFVHALQRTGYGKVRKTSDTDERGVCATGQRYTFEVFNDGKNVSRTWAGTCTKGTSQARAAEVLQLFRAQITGYGKLTNNVDLSAN
ncbi:MAG: hypothetical protein QG628_627 [Patescibacteria group bacterium]|jgi:hypothetical protein|nr:hypothetical protein [Patescibacteria group bacterium]